MNAPSTHASLLLRLRDGDDQEAWERFCRDYGSLIRSYGRRRGLQESERDDLLQEVLLALSKALPGFTYDPAKGKLRGYLKAVTERTISRLLRQKSRGVTLALDDGGEEQHESTEVEAWEGAWREHHLRRAMSRARKEFPETTCTAFELYGLGSRGAAETAELLGLSLDQVYQAKSRLLRRISELVAEQVREEG